MKFRPLETLLRSQLSDRLFVKGVGLLPQKRLSRGVRRLAGVHAPFAVRRFAARYQVAVEEAEKPLDAYGSVLDFFTRRLKPGVRPLDADPEVLLCPVDGTFDASGVIRDGRLIQAKGREYTLAALLASEERARRYEGGSFATLYLAPRDYHRVHSPVTGKVAGATYVPGLLNPVNPAAVAHVDALFASNERLITHLESERFGAIEYVMVGATCVGHMRVVYDDALVTNVGGEQIIRKTYHPARPIERGAELGVFEMGSTVILVLEPGLELEPLPLKARVRVGRALARRRR